MAELITEELPGKRADGWRYVNLIWYKGCAELRADASRAYLGLLWWVVEPVLYMAAFYVIFALGLRMSGPDFVPFLLCGLVQWKYFNSTVSAGAGVVVANRALISQVYFPKVILIAVSTFVNFVRYLIIAALFLVFLVLYGYEPSLGWLAGVPVALAGVVLVAGLSALFACIVPFIPDVRLLITNGLTMLFFMSGIFFDMARYPDDVREWLMLNPVAGWITNMRLVFLQGEAPDWGEVLYCLAIGLVCLAAGVLAFRRLDRHFAKSAIW